MVSDTATAFRPPKIALNRADDSDKDTQDNDGLELGNAKDSGQVENVFKHQRTRVQDYRNLHEQVQNDVCDGEPQLSGSVIALTGAAAGMVVMPLSGSAARQTTPAR